MHLFLETTEEGDTIVTPKPLGLEHIYTQHTLVYNIFLCTYCTPDSPSFPVIGGRRKDKGVFWILNI